MRLSGKYWNRMERSFDVIVLSLFSDFALSCLFGIPSKADERSLSFGFPVCLAKVAIN